MGPLELALIALGALIFLFIVVIIIRTLRFKPANTVIRDSEKVDFDGDRALTSLRELVMCKTVSSYDPRHEDDAEFEKFIAN